MTAGRLCPDCGAHPRSEGRSYCPGCAAKRSARYAAKRREAMGEEAWLEHRRKIHANHRERTGNATGKKYQRAVARAVKRLKAAHPDEWSEILDEERKNDAG